MIGWTDRQTDVKKLTVAFSKFVQAPKNVTSRQVTTKRPDDTCVTTRALIKFSFYIHVPNNTVRFRIA